jgi:GNAT superfamily N-acetyltransferase
MHQDMVEPGAPTGVTVRAFEAADEPLVLDLLRDVFGRWPDAGQGDAAGFFRWKHLENPFGPSVLFVTEVEGAMVGFQALLRWQLRVDGRVVHAVRGADVAVRPEVRRRGVAGAMVAATNAGRPAVTQVGFSNPNGMSRPMLEKLGRREVGPFRFMGRPRQPLRLLVPALRRDGERPAVDAPPAAGVLTDDLGPSLAALGRVPGRLATNATLQFLRWRYGARPGYWAVRTDAGLAIFRLVRRGGMWVQVLSELLVAEGDARGAGRLLRAALATTSADYATCNPPPGSTAAGAALRHGFVRSIHRHAIHVNPIDQEARPNLVDRRSWALSCGDFELM